MNYESYRRTAGSIPMLTPQQEIELGRAVRDNQDEAARETLINSHLKLVISVARRYKDYGIDHDELVSEGNIGLVKAVGSFDPDHESGAKFASYVIPWIESEIKNFVVKNVKMLNIATTKPYKKLFFNLRSLIKKIMHERHIVAPESSYRLHEEDVAKIAKILNVKEEEVREMHTRLTASHDISLFEGGDSDEDSASNQILLKRYQEELSNDDYEPSSLMIKSEYLALTTDVEEAIGNLDDRSKFILQERLLKNAPIRGNSNNDTRPAMTLSELSALYGISAERVRQIESAALKKIRKALNVETL